MHRWLAFSGLLLLIGCHAPSAPPSASIDSYRTSFLAGKGPLPEVAKKPAMAEDAAPVEASEPPPPAQPANRSTAKPTPAAAPGAQHASANYKAPVAAYIKRYAVNANSLKQARIGTPFAGAVHGQKGSVVCVELDGMRANRTAYLLRDGAVIDSEYGAESCRDQQLAAWDDTGT